MYYTDFKSCRAYLGQGVRRRRHKGLQDVHDVPQIPELGIDVEELGVVAAEVQPRLVSGKAHLQANL